MINYPYFTSNIHPITISVIGAGGNGSQLLTQLARINKALIGLGSQGIFVSVFDKDLVTEANIGRQLFSTSDIGQNKAEVLVNRLNTYFGTQWIAIDELIESEKPPCNMFWSNIIITCTDNKKSRIDVNYWIKHQEVEERDLLEVYYWMDIGNSKDIGQVIMGTTNKKTVDIPTILEFYPNYETVPEDNNTPSCSLAEALSKQDLLVNTFITNIAAKLLWDVLRLKELNWHGAFYNGSNLNIKKLKC